MPQTLTLDLGIKTYVIQDPDGNPAGEIRFNPSDPGLAGRWRKAMDVVERYRKQVDDETAAGKEEAELWPLLMEASDAIKNALDYAFGARVSDVLFGGASAFAMTVDGSMVLENVLKGLSPVIEEALKSSAGNARTRMQKHTAPYQGTTRGLAPGQALPGDPDDAPA